jgi:hypothetical protein
MLSVVPGSTSRVLSLLLPILGLSPGGEAKMIFCAKGRRGVALQRFFSEE